MAHRRLQRCPTVSFLGHSKSLERPWYRRAKKDVPNFSFSSHSNIAWAFSNLVGVHFHHFRAQDSRQNQGNGDTAQESLRELSSDPEAGANHHRFPPSYDDFAEALGENDEPPHPNPICVSFSMSLADNPSHVVRGRPEFPTEV